MHTYIIHNIECIIHLCTRAYLSRKSASRGNMSRGMYVTHSHTWYDSIKTHHVTRFSHYTMAGVLLFNKLALLSSERASLVHSWVIDREKSIG